MGRIDNSEFLTQVQELLDSNNGTSSVYITQKRLTSSVDGSEGIDDLASNVVDYDEKYPANKHQYPVLVRVTTGGKKKKKLSTVVEKDNLDQFWNDYAQVIKAGFVGLKKKDKKKSKKHKVSK